MGPVVITLFLVGVLVAEHFLAKVVYDTTAKGWSEEYVRRLRISLKAIVVLTLGFVWVITLDGGMRIMAGYLMGFLLLAMLSLGVWTMLGARKNKPR